MTVCCLVGPSSVCHNCLTRWEVALPCSYRSICYFIFLLFQFPEYGRAVQLRVRGYSGQQRQDYGKRQVQRCRKRQVQRWRKCQVQPRTVQKCELKLNIFLRKNRMCLLVFFCFIQRKMQSIILEWKCFSSEKFIFIDIVKFY